MDKAIESENKYVKKNFNLSDIMDFQKDKDIQIIRGEDYSYHCYINKQAFGTAFTPLFALVFGIEQYKKLYKNEK